MQRILQTYSSTGRLNTSPCAILSSAAPFGMLTAGLWFFPCPVLGWMMMLERIMPLKVSFYRSTILLHGGRLPERYEVFLFPSYLRVWKLTRTDSIQELQAWSWAKLDTERLVDFISHIRKAFSPHSKNPGWVDVSLLCDSLFQDGLEGMYNLGN